MVRTKALVIAVATILAVGSAGVWFLISEKQEAQERRAKFFGSSKEYPTSGGEKMKVEW
ncbi:entry exclusion protein TrbK [Rhizobium binae]|uniref:Ti type entry exclusion protein TrbK n=1 Tax=Rhizobium binae TaxID=1138190 RepID=A0ABV2MSJ8_9HYPH|nr:entry exclusion protein TrbK [Rhizobium binae]NKL51905.1 entry exclusion protein TrbK [Rhizobium leguminosarum bv. viciae]MBX4939104.1 entry exclusion protein TrbK [Rhizobium binae]MBX4945629.1 entry exclusion protein TrbK [Rhizobium binae]MBX4981094.1 entry exclusion protein TrbK [Rhizobium binae]MBX4995648.1 entry exclusion protein TrbK [Rhizobium binae]